MKRLAKRLGLIPAEHCEYYTDPTTKGRTVICRRWIGWLGMKLRVRESIVFDRW